MPRCGLEGKPDDLQGDAKSHLLHISIVFQELDQRRISNKTVADPDAFQGHGIGESPRTSYFYPVAEDKDPNLCPVQTVIPVDDGIYERLSGRRKTLTPAERLNSRRETNPQEHFIHYLNIASLSPSVKPG